MGNETVDFFRAAGDMLAFIGAIHVELFGAQIYVADLVGIAMVRLMAVIMTGIVMAGFGEFYPSEISGGMQRRAGIARAMALDPEILFFDDVGLRALLTTQSIITGQLMIELDFYPNTPRQICVIDGHVPQSTIGTINESVSILNQHLKIGEWRSWQGFWT